MYSGGNADFVRFDFGASGIIQNMISKKNYFIAAFLIVFFSQCNVRKNNELKTPAGDAPAGMVWIPAGEFMMGGTEEHPDKNALPVHAVKLEGFWMDETEVTNTQFKSFVDDTGYKTVAERPIDWKSSKQAPRHASLTTPLLTTGVHGLHATFLIRYAERLYSMVELGGRSQLAPSRRAREFHRWKGPTPCSSHRL